MDRPLGTLLCCHCPKFPPRNYSWSAFKTLLRLYALLINDRILAVYYGFLSKGRAYYYLSGFEPEFEKYSLGTLIVGHGIEETIREGANEFDFLRGQEAYKYKWGAQDRFNYRRQLWRAEATL
jgi:CelD/BcsL family acetyltransferase involved in cellulose biosynthesis